MPSPAYSLAQDPAYLAFLRSSGLESSIAAADADRRRNDINQALGIATDDLNATGEQERRSIDENQEDRGVFRSGQTLRRQSDQESSQGRRRSAIELAASGQLGDIETGLLTSLAGLQTRGAELGLTLAGNRALEDGTAGLIGYTGAPATAAVPVATSTSPLAVPAAAPAPVVPSTPYAPTSGLGGTYKRRTGRQQEY